MLFNIKFTKIKIVNINFIESEKIQKLALDFKKQSLNYQQM